MLVFLTCHRQEAFLELGRLLITALVLPAHNSAQASFPDRGASTAEAAPDLSTTGTSEQNAAGCAQSFRVSVLSLQQI